MKTDLRTKRIAPLALAVLAAGGLLAGCHRDNGNADTGDNMAAATPAAPNATTPPATSSTMPADTTAMDNGMPPGTTTDNASTTAGATPGMATSADASAMAAASGPVTDTQFYEQALAGGEKEIAASKLAQKNGGAKVKDFARMIISDHTKLGDKVKAAAGKDVTAPPPPDTAALDGKTGNDFDTAYLDQMVSDHQNAIAMFENASKNASTDKAKKLAGDALPTLRKHLDAAQKLQASMK